MKFAHSRVDHHSITKLVCVSLLPFPLFLFFFPHAAFAALSIDGPPQTGQATAVSTLSTATGLTTSNAGDIVVCQVHAEWSSGPPNGTVTGVSGGGLVWEQRSAFSWVDDNDAANDAEMWWAYAPSSLSAAVITATFSAPGGQTLDDSTIACWSVTGFSGTYYETDPWDTNSSLPAETVEGYPNTVVFGVMTNSADDMLIATGADDGIYYYGSTDDTPFNYIADILNGGDVNQSEIVAQYEVVSAIQSSTSVDFTPLGPAGDPGSYLVDALVQNPVQPAAVGRIVRLLGGLHLLGGVRLE